MKVGGAALQQHDEGRAEKRRLKSLLLNEAAKKEEEMDNQTWA